jgi:hypothetical protein
LKQLKINSNYIRWISTQAFNGLLQLSTLTLYDNDEMLRFDPNIFKPLPSTAQLLLTDDSRISSPLFDNVGQLKRSHLEDWNYSPDSNIDTHIYLNSTGIKQIDPQTFNVGFATNLIHLNLSSNSIESISNLTFNHLDSLRELLISGNSLKEISPCLFCQLKSKTFSSSSLSFRIFEL